MPGGEISPSYLRLVVVVVLLLFWQKQRNEDGGGGQHEPTSVELLEGALTRAWTAATANGERHSLDPSAPRRTCCRQPLRSLEYPPGQTLPALLRQSPLGCAPSLARRWLDAGKLSPGPLVTAVTIVTAPSVRLQYGPQTNLDAITEMPTWDAAPPPHPRPSVHATWISLSTPRWNKC